MLKKPLMAKSRSPPQEPFASSGSTSNSGVPDSHHPSLWRRLLGRTNGNGNPASTKTSDAADFPKAAVMEVETEKVEELPDPDDPRPVPTPIRRVHRNVVPGLPRAQTFRRQQSELRDNLMPVEPDPTERRAVSHDRRLQSFPLGGPEYQTNPRSSAPEFLLSSAAIANGSSSAVPPGEDPSASAYSLPASSVGESRPDMTIPALPNGIGVDGVGQYPFRPAPETWQQMDTASMTTSQYDQLIHDDLERIWILNLSMQFRDKSKREKFFVTYRQERYLWRRVTISLDYRAAPENSLELDLEHTRFQRDKNAKIYEAIRESLQDIQFYNTVTNLKLQTTDGRLHVHVVEDVNEIIPYPTARMIQHLRCRMVKEQEVEFDSHMSGFVYKVIVHGQTLIKKEIPGQNTVEEFLYEVNALAQLRDSRHVIEFYGVIVDDQEEHVKGLLIRYAENGQLVDMIYDHDHRLPWPRREKWARQIVEGLSEIHEAGFVQGDFTLSNIVIDHNDDAKIIDINRRGCPVGWEPPEATPLIESGHQISMYIGVKSDLYQLGMVLWALATQEDEPEAHGRPLQIDPAVDCPNWFRTVVYTCLAEDPRLRAQATTLVGMFPGPDSGDRQTRPHHTPSISIDEVSSMQSYGAPIIKTVGSPPLEWGYKTFGHTFVDAPRGMSNEPYYFHMRGRSPPSPIASNAGGDSCRRPTWSAYSYDQSRSEPSISEAIPGHDYEDGGDDKHEPDDLRVNHAGERSVTPRTNNGSVIVLDREADPTETAREVLEHVDDVLSIVEDEDETPRIEGEVGAGGNLPLLALTTGDSEVPESSAAAKMKPEAIPLPSSPEEQESTGPLPDTAPQGYKGPSAKAGGSVEHEDLGHHSQKPLEAGEPGSTVPEDQINSSDTQPLPSLPGLGPSSQQAPLTNDEAAATEQQVVSRAGAATASGSISGSAPSRARHAKEKVLMVESSRATQLVAEPHIELGFRRGPRFSSPSSCLHSPLPPSSTSPNHRGSPVRETLLDELKGIGAAYEDHTDEETIRNLGGSIDDDLSLLAAPTMVTMTTVTAPTTTTEYSNDHNNQDQDQDQAYHTAVTTEG